MNTQKTSHNQGFSLVEIIAVLAVIGMMAAVATPIIVKIRKGSQSTKLSSETSALNSAVKSFLASGESIGSTATAEDVLVMLKATLSREDAEIHVGYSGSFIDYRLTGTPVDEETEGTRVVWNPEKQRFELTDDLVPGIGTFFLDDEATRSNDTRIASAPFEYSRRKDNGWVWDYDENTTKVAVTPSTFSRNAQAGESVDPILITLREEEDLPEEDPFEPQTEDPNRLSPPLFSINGGRYPLVDYHLPLQLHNPNSDISGTIFFRTDARYQWQLYREGLIIAIDPDTSVDAYILPDDQAQYIASNVASSTYGSDPVNLELLLHADKSSVSYYDLLEGDVMLRWKVTNLDEIPEHMKTDGFFSTYFTTDGSDPAYPTNRSNGERYSEEYEGEMMRLNPMRWGDEDTLELTVYAESRTAEWVNHSDKPVASISIARESLPCPVIEMEEVDDGVFRVSLTTPRELPDGAKVYYNTNGETMVQNQNNGNVARGTIYTGPFLWEPEEIDRDFSSDETVTIDSGSGDVTIEQVVLKSNGNTMDQSHSVAFDEPNETGNDSSRQVTVHDSSSDEVTLEEISISDNGTVITVGNVNFLDLQVKNLSLPPHHADQITASENGVTIGNASEPGFEDQVKTMLKSRDLRDYVNVDGLPPGMSFGFDVSFSPLRNDDYLVIMERSGDSTITLEALDASGSVIPGSNQVVVREYSWNTGHAPSDSAEQPMFLAALDIEQFGVDTDLSSITGFRVDNSGGADFKFFTISKDTFENRPVHFDGSLTAISYPPVQLANWFTPSVATAIHVTSESSDGGHCNGNGNNGNGHSNNGHGNNEDGVDSSNPGNGHGGPNGEDDPSGDVDDEGGSGNSNGGGSVDGSSGSSSDSNSNNGNSNNGNSNNGNSNNGNSNNGNSNNGHGNNEDGVDVSNPGNGNGGPNGEVDPSGDVDDESSPGNGGGGNSNSNGKGKGKGKG